MAAPFAQREAITTPSGPALGTLVHRFNAHRHRRPRDGETAAMLARVRDAFRKDIVPAPVVEAADALTRATIWLVEDAGEPQGVSLWLPLNVRGARAMADGRFRPEAVEGTQLAPAGAPVAAVYHWGFAGFTAAARRSIMTLCAELLAGPLNGVDVYGRVVTDEGAAACARLGIVPCFELGDGFYVHRAGTPVPEMGAVA